MAFCRSYNLATVSNVDTKLEDPRVQLSLSLRKPYLA